MAAGTQVEDVVDGGSDLAAGSTVSVPNVSTRIGHRAGHADGVGDLDLTTVGRAGGNDVLRHPAGGVGGRAVDLRRVLAGEGTAAVAGRMPP